MMKRTLNPFNSTIEIGLRSTVILLEMYPMTASLQRLVIYDYLLVHSDDVPDGPKGLHPKTPYRNGEILIRRGILQKGLDLYISRNLIDVKFTLNGIQYIATEHTGGFIESFDSPYMYDLQKTTTWLVDRFSDYSDNKLQEFSRTNLGKWGIEFESSLPLWKEEDDE